MIEDRCEQHGAAAAVLITCSAALMMLVLSACGTSVVGHEVSIAFRDPSNRLGPPPWAVRMDSDLDLYDGGSVGEGSQGAAPDAPHRGTFSVVEGVSGFSARSNSHQLGLIIPALSTGWWKTVLLIFDDGSCRGYARRSAFGELFPPSRAETLLIRGTATPIPDGDGWRFDLTIDIPPAPTRAP